MKTRLFLLFLLSVSLAGCAARGPVAGTAPATKLYQQRFAQIESASGWSLTARLGVEDGVDGGSGRLDWNANSASQTLRFRGALGQGAWRLDIDERSARLQRADGVIREALNVNDLVLGELGWQAPVDALAWWVRGLAQPGDGSSAELVLSANGTPETIQHEGWLVEFNRFTEHEGVLLPSRLEATKGPYVLKLAISRWSLPGVGSE